jgi:phospho-N-acetylmuramoyl-pentapeptide-transferase
VLLTIWGFAAVGAWDDWAKISRNRGISEAHKFCAQGLVGLVVMLVWWFFDPPSTLLVVPFFKGLTFYFGPFFIIWGLWVILCTVNAVNFTDGLDGLATITLIFNFVTFALIAYVVGNELWANYLYVPFAGTAELVVVITAIIGALLGFLWYNTYPAQIFMGDVGSLSLGSALALVALMAKQECLIPIAGGLFVVEGVSVALQICVFKFFGRRVFKMAPLHHHFELVGWPESKITIRFAIITFLLCITALVTLKLR